MGIIDGFTALFSGWSPVFFAIFGTFVGLLAGALPGLSSSATIALLIPVTFYMDTLPALVFIYTISKAADFGGSIPAILFNTPGTPQAAATQQEGYPLTQQGKQGKALRMAVIASASGDMISELLLIFGAAYIAVYAAQMGPAEYTAVYFCAFIIISSLIGDSIIKGLLSTLLGVLVALIGFDSITAEERYSFGISYLLEGVALVPVLLGLFVMSEVFIKVADRMALSGDTKIAPRSEKPEDNRVTWTEYKRVVPVIYRSTAFGAVIGMLPGIGASVASFVAYAEAKRTSKQKDTWGKGEIEGIAASEAANNATSGANLIPLLTLGIPGSTSAALLAGVMLIHGINIGPSVFVTSHDLIYGLFASGLLCILTYLILGYWGSGLVGRLIAVVPVKMVYPFIFITCSVATYAVRLALFDLVLMTFFGVVGFLMKKFKFSIPAFIIAFILGDGAERSLRQAMMLDDAGAWVFFQRPLALFFFALGFLAIYYRFRQLREAKKAAA
ncbi:MAG: tripartite tricarboxylate transporter permease [Methylococcales bacterium]|nr:tripartite tricarboxylate transporter permease [Methylococcales bacterium]